MRYAIFSDLHANLPAWNAIYADMAEQGAESILCLGDIVGYGPKPQEVLDAVRAATGNIVLGNHDAAVCGRMDASIFNDNAREIVEWTRSVLREDSLQFFAQVPLTLNDGSGMLVVHAEIEEPGRFGYIIEPADAARNLLATSARITFVGHTHAPCIFVSNRLGAVEHHEPKQFKTKPNTRYIVNVGSAGEPRDWDVRASYCIYDDVTGVVTFRKVAFDVEAYRADIEASGLDIQPFFLYAYDHLAAGGTAPDEVVNPAANAAMTGRLHVPVAAKKKQALVTQSSSAPVSVKKKTGALKLPGSAAAPSARPPASPATLPKKNSSKTGVLIGSLLAIAACLIGGLWLLAANNKKLSKQAQIAAAENESQDSDMSESDEELSKVESEPEPEADVAPLAVAAAPVEEVEEELSGEDAAPSAAASLTQKLPEKGLIFHAAFEDSADVITAEGDVGKKMNVNQEPDTSPFASGIRGGKALQVRPQTFLGIVGEGELALDRPFSLSVWIIIQEGGPGGIFSKQDGWDSKSAGTGYGMHVGAKLHPFLSIRSTEENITLKIASNTKLRRARWYHLAVTFSGGSAAENFGFYINGKPVEYTSHGNTLPTSGIASKSPFVIGNAPGANSFSGKIDDLSIYDRVLEGSEIEALSAR